MTETTRRTPQPWSDWEIEIVRDKTATQCADLLPHRTIESIHSKRRLLARGKSKKNYLVDPSYISPGSILLAKTCIKCGNLIDGQFFADGFKRPGVRRYAATCAFCNRERQRARKRDRSDEAKNQTRAYAKRMAEMTSPAARGREEYTSKDIEVLANPNKTILEKALETQRTYQAVAIWTHLNGYSSAHSRTLGELEDGIWNIDFPASRPQ